MGLFVSVFDSSGELAGQPEFSGSCARVCSGAELEVGRSSSEDGHGPTVNAPMDFESSMHYSTCL